MDIESIKEKIKEDYELKLDRLVNDKCIKISKK